MRKNGICKVKSVNHALRSIDKQIKKLNYRSDVDNSTDLVVSTLGKLNMLYKVILKERRDLARKEPNASVINGGFKETEILKTLEHFYQLELRLVSRYVKYKSQKLVAAEAQCQLKGLLRGFKRTLNRLTSKIRPEGYEGFCYINNRFLMLNEREYQRGQHRAAYLLGKLEIYMSRIEPLMEEVKTMRLEVFQEVTMVLKGLIHQEILKIPDSQVYFRNLAKPQYQEREAFAQSKRYSRTVELTKYLYQLEDVSEVEVLNAAILASG